MNIVEYWHQILLLLLIHIYGYVSLEKKHTTLGDQSGNTGYYAKSGVVFAEKEKAVLTVPPPWSAVCSTQTNRGSCSPHGWASCLLGMLGAFLSDALSAEAGLYLRSLCQGQYSDRAKLVKKLLLKLTLCGSTQCTKMLSWKANFEALKQNVSKKMNKYKERVANLEERHNTILGLRVNQWKAELNHKYVMVNAIKFPQLKSQTHKAEGWKHAVS